MAHHPSLGRSRGLRWPKQFPALLATLVDSVLLGILFVVVGAPFGLFSQDGGGVFGALLSLPFVVVRLAYYVWMEGSRGQTLGKMLRGIKVVPEDTGGTPGFGAAALRTVPRFVDGIGPYLAGFIVVPISGKRQRLGGVAARTLVIRA